jgi:hypothetical protein
MAGSAPGGCRRPGLARMSLAPAVPARAPGGWPPGLAPAALSGSLAMAHRRAQCRPGAAGTRPGQAGMRSMRWASGPLSCPVGARGRGPPGMGATGRRRGRVSRSAGFWGCGAGGAGGRRGVRLRAVLPASLMQGRHLASSRGVA